ncbi:hypothetical protein DRO27_00730 [Candidatus Bathyarchaeota archaeon]|nr:MAG: hypothetical protein DRO27_00730 [Candidatus Bathyarchaeota archaeon]
MAYFMNSLIPILVICLFIIPVVAFISQGVQRRNKEERDREEMLDLMRKTAKREEEEGARAQNRLSIYIITG